MSGLPTLLTRGGRAPNLVLYANARTRKLVNLGKSDTRSLAEVLGSMRVNAGATKLLLQLSTHYGSMGGYDDCAWSRYPNIGELDIGSVGLE